MSPSGHVVPLPLGDTSLDGRSNVPVIRLAHDDLGDDDFYYEEEGSSIEIKFTPRLSRISEVPEPSERSSVSSRVSSQRSSARHSAAAHSVLSSSTTDYGEIVREFAA